MANRKKFSRKNKNNKRRSSTAKSSTTLFPTSSKKGDKKYKEWWSKIVHQKEAATKRKWKEIDRFRRFYEGSQWSGDMTHQANNQVVDNMVYRVVSTLAPAIAINRPEVFVTAMRSKFQDSQGNDVDAVANTMTNKVLLSYLFDRLGLEVEFIKQVADSLIAHEGINYVGYDLTLMEVEVEGEVIDFIDREDLISKRIDSKDFLKDPFSMDHNLSDASWVAVRWRRPLDQVKKDKRFKNNSNLSGTGRIAIDGESGEMIFHEHPLNMSRVDNAVGQDWEEFVEGWDIWDKEGQNLMTLVENHDSFLFDGDWPLNYNGNGYPFDILWYNYNPKRPYPLADTAIYQSKQQVVNLLSSKIVDYADRVANIKYVLNGKMFPDKSYIDRWAAGPSGSWIKSKGDAQQAVQVISGQGGTNDLYNTLSLQKLDILSSIGVSAFEAGQTVKSESAEEAARIGQGSSDKKEFRRRAVERHEAAVMGKLSFVAQQVINDTEIPLDEGQFSEIAKTSPSLLVNDPNQAAQEQEDGSSLQPKLPFMLISQQRITGDFQFSVRIGSTGPVNEATEREEGAALMALGEKNPLIDTVEATKLGLEKMGFGQYLGRLMRDPQEVAQESQKAKQEAIQASLLEPQLKTSTDLKKTAAKVQSAETVARIKAGTDDSGQVRKQESEKDKAILAAMQLIIDEAANNNGAENK